MNYFIINKFWKINKRWKIDKDYNIDKLLYILIDKPDETNETNEHYIRWINDKYQWHRDYDLPSVIWSDREVVWYKNGIHIQTVMKDIN